MKTKRVSVRYMIKLLCPVTNSLQPFSKGNASDPFYIILLQVRHATKSELGNTFVSMADVTAGGEARLLPASTDEVLGSGRV